MLTKQRPDNITRISTTDDLFKAAKNNVANTNQSVIILNPCNNMNTFGAGFNKAVAEEFPLAKENYHMLGATVLKNKLGYAQVVPVATNNKYKNQIFIANMICQTGIISTNNPRPFNYYYFGMCLEHIQNYVKQYKHNSDLGILVYCPKIHMGVTGANWSFILDIMSDVLKRPTYVMVYE
jgi:hypothetical protein